MKGFLIFCMPATLVTALPFAVFNAPPGETGAGQVFAGLLFLAFTVLFLAIPAAIAWPFLLKLFTRISAPRPLLDVLTGILMGDLVTLVFGADMGGFWSRVYFMVGFGVAAWCYWWWIERSRSQRALPSDDDANERSAKF